MFLAISCLLLSSVHGITTSSEMTTSSTPQMSSSTTAGPIDCQIPSSVITLDGRDAANTECTGVTSASQKCAWTTVSGFGCDFDTTLTEGSCEFAVNEPVCAPCQDMSDACGSALAASIQDKTINCDTVLLTKFPELTAMLNNLEGITITADVTMKEVCPMSFDCFSECSPPPQAGDVDCSGYFSCTVECELAADRVFTEVTPQSGNGMDCPVSADQNCLYANSENPDSDFQILSTFQQCQESVSLEIDFGNDVCDDTCEIDLSQAITDTFSPKEVDVTIIQTGGNQRRLFQGNLIKAIVVPSATATGDAAISFDELVTTTVADAATFQADFVVKYQEISGSNTVTFEVTATETTEPQPVSPTIDAVAALQASLTVVAAGILFLIIA